MHIVLVEPEIPGNTGNIARLCAGTGIELHLVRPLGFSTDDKHLKRAGLDYWHLVKVHYHDSFADVQQQYTGSPFYFCTTKAKHSYSDIVYTSDSILVFGKETAGLPEPLLAANEERTIRIPMPISTVIAFSKASRVIISRGSSLISSRKIFARVTL